MLSLQERFSKIWLNPDPAKGSRVYLQPLIKYNKNKTEEWGENNIYEFSINPNDPIFENKDGTKVFQG
jgi:hypothetical protein